MRGRGGRRRARRARGAGPRAVAAPSPTAHPSPWTPRTPPGGSRRCRAPASPGRAARPPSGAPASAGAGGREAGGWPVWRRQGERVERAAAAVAGATRGPRWPLRDLRGRDRTLAYMVFALVFGLFAVALVRAFRDGWVRSGD